MKAGTVVWIDLDPTVGHEQAGTRPALVVADMTKSMILVVPLTGAPPKMRSHIPVTHDRGNSTALCEQVRSVDRVRIDGMIGTIELHELALVRQTLTDIIIGAD